MSIRRVLPTFVACFVLSLAVPGVASAQWYFAGYLGGNHSFDATVSIRAPTQSLALDFRDVQFAAQANYPRRYYGWRIGKMFGKLKRLGLEFEHIHMKALGDVTRSYDVVVYPDTVLPPGGAQPMSNVVQEYQMTHGLNFMFVNTVLRQPLGGSDKISLMLRAGAGPTFPHAESTVFGQIRHEYQFGGFGLQGAAGVQVALPYRLSVVAEYKFTFTRPKIALAEGDGWMYAATQHFVAGMGVNITR